MGETYKVITDTTTEYADTEDDAMAILNEYRQQNIAASLYRIAFADADDDGTEELINWVDPADEAQYAEEG
jgi:hypothetical protein